jgi:RNA polymerase sigma factor (sigma-70 family)
MTTQTSPVVQHLRRAGLLHDAEQRTDGQLLESFLSHRDGAALEALVRRHGAMVWGVCRRVLRNHHDAEDAFQASFLVLVRKAASIRPREMVGNWLYGVAHQTALKARATAAKQRARERQAIAMPEPAVKEPELGDWQAVLDQELSRLPDSYRVAIVLCDLEGKTRIQAARQLGVPEGTLASRRARARALLAKRLARLGLAVSGGALAGLLSRQASAGVPPALLSATLEAAYLLAAGRAMGAVTAPVATLTEGVLKAMLLTRVKTALGIGLVVSLLMLGSVVGLRAFAADRTTPGPTRDRLADTLILLDKQWWEAASRYDVDTLGKILADDWVGPSGSNWNRAKSLDHYRRFRYTEVKILTERRVVRVDERTAMMTYEVAWRAEDRARRPQGEGHDRIIHCWVQRDGGWFVKFTECVNLPLLKAAPPALVPVRPNWPFPLKGPVDQSPLIVPNLIVPTPAPTPAPAWKRGVRASGTWQTETPEKAFDGRHDTDWNSGQYAPAWIERDLGASQPLSSITLLPAQDIPGLTVHEVWVSNEPIGNDRAKARRIHTFKCETTNKQVLRFDFPKGLCVRYVLVRTTQSPTWVAWWEIEVRVHDEKVVPLGARAEPKKATDDRKALQGTWQVVSVETGGKDVTPRWEKAQEWVVKGHWINVRSTDPLHVPHSEVFTIRPDRGPKEIDINPYPIGVYLPSDVVKGIYTLEGDVWKVCLPYIPLAVPRGKQSTARPKDMASKAGGTTFLITLKRVKAPG